MNKTYRNIINCIASFPTIEQVLRKKMHYRLVGEKRGMKQYTAIHLSDCTYGVDTLSHKHWLTEITRVMSQPHYISTKQAVLSSPSVDGGVNVSYKEHVNASDFAVCVKTETFCGPCGE